jgi:hypothetical protein
VVQAWGCDHKRAIGLEVQARARVKFPQRAIEDKIMMWSLAPTEGYCGMREWPVGVFEVL